MLTIQAIAIGNYLQMAVQAHKQLTFYSDTEEPRRS